MGPPRRPRGEILLARSLLSSCQGDLAKLLGEVKEALRGRMPPISRSPA